MLGFMVLTPEEAELVMHGGIEDPRYRPFPASRADRLSEARADPYYDEELNVDALAEDVESSRHKQQRFVRSSASKHWNRHAASDVLLLTHTDQTYQIVAIAAIAGGTRLGRETGVRRVTVGPWRAVSPPITFDDLLVNLPSASRRYVMGLLDGPARPFPPKAGADIRHRLTELNPDYQPLSSQPHLLARRRSTEYDLQRRDRNATALKMFGIHQWISAEPSPGTQTEEADAIYAAFASSSAIEADYITDDAAVFPSWDRSPQSQMGWWEFRSKNRRLLIKNVNASPTETATGADLVYVRRDPDAVVLVQYKVLEQLQTSGRFVYRPDERLRSQVERLRRLETKGRPIATDADTYRIGHGFSFVKFVTPYPKYAPPPDTLTDGYYMPTEIVEHLLRNPDKGQRGGKLLSMDKHRYIDPTTFVKLVQDSWIGSHTEASKLLLDLMGLKDRGERNPATIAVDTPIQFQAPNRR
ncbi:Uncharacterised protein [Mycobacteroides abscessus subsp. abscessus]|uniref:hypothetical protein n=1 Tax=Mycobacteroides abscessus TaxID=36809 RepID=UPI00092A5A6C|nr:hypothetical protein [Mycobacteroides abscessus]SIF22457.1 Uncharacterised protein [Mycobacteroides abscessus subsp. abscessus]